MQRFGWKRWGAVALALFAAWVVSQILWGGTNWSQRLTVTVSVDGKPVSASAVTRINVRGGGKPILPDAGVYSFNVRGEAVALEIPGRGWLFALFKPSPYILAEDAFNAFRLAVDSGKERYSMIPDYIGQTVTLQPKNHPLLVTFDDPARPETVKRVDPANLAASFGAGVRLESITLTITDEKPTDGVIEKVLPWLGKYPEPGLCPATGRTTNIPFCRKVRHGDFIFRK